MFIKESFLVIKKVDRSSILGPFNRKERTPDHREESFSKQRAAMSQIRDDAENEGDAEARDYFIFLGNKYVVSIVKTEINKKGPQLVRGWLLCWCWILLIYFSGKHDSNNTTTLLIVRA
jgi:hypothetical protein